MLRTSRRRGLRRVATAVPIAAVAFAGANLTSVAHATIVPTTTTLTAPASAGVGQSVTLIAGVTPTGLLAGLTAASGNVTFKVGSTSLGTKTLSGCQAGKTCSTSLSTTALPKGTDTLTAVFSGGGGTAGSTSAPRSIDIVDVTTTTDSTGCTEGTDCDTGTSYSPDLSASLRLQLHGGNTGGGNYHVDRSFGGSPLSCQTITDGASGNYLVSTNDVIATITYQLIGQAANESHAANPNNVWDLCYGAPEPFTTAGGGTSAFNTANQEYEGVPAACNALVTNTPCQKAQDYGVGNGPGGTNTVTFVLVVNAATTAGGNGTGDTCSHHNNQPQNCNSADPRTGGG